VGGRRLSHASDGGVKYSRRPIAIVAPASGKRIELSVEWPEPAEKADEDSLGELSKRSKASGAAPRYAAIIPEIVRKMASVRGLIVFTDSRRRAERMAFLVNEAKGEGLAWAHPYQPEALAQGAMEVMARLEAALAEITGMDAVTLQPSAGAQGELTGILLIRALLQKRGDPRRKILIPDSAHGTNPATAAIAGYVVENVKSTDTGVLDLEALARAADGDVAALMVTNPNTLGVFEENIVQAAEILHAKGAMLYMDGANMNALVGIARPGDFGVDVLHLNLHKTFSTPHGGGGPGAGPVVVRDILEPYLPVPVLKKTAAHQYTLDYDRPRSIGKVRSFYGNFGVLVRAYAYISALGAEGLREVSDAAVLNATYVMAGVRDLFDVPYERPVMHEFVVSAEPLRAHGVRALDVAKRLLDYGVHPPTTYFPLIVKEALMVEPTETESKDDLDAFVAAVRAVVGEARSDPELLRTAPHTMPVGRLDEVAAARNPVLSQRFPDDEVAAARPT